MASALNEASHLMLRFIGKRTNDMIKLDGTGHGPLRSAYGYEHVNANKGRLKQFTIAPTERRLGSGPVGFPSSAHPK